MIDIEVTVGKPSIRIGGSNYNASHLIFDADNGKLRIRVVSNGRMIMEDVSWEKIIYNGTQISSAADLKTKFGNFHASY